MLHNHSRYYIKGKNILEFPVILIISTTHIYTSEYKLLVMALSHAFATIISHLYIILVIHYHIHPFTNFLYFHDQMSIYPNHFQTAKSPDTRFEQQRDIILEGARTAACTQLSQP